MGDERIRAAMPMGAEGYDMTGPDGLAEATAAVLLIGAGADTGNDYDPATTELFNHDPGADLITVVGAHHLMVFEPDAVDQMRRFAVAFFGYRLAGRDEYARFLTEHFVEEEAPRLGPTDSFETLIWEYPRTSGSKTTRPYRLSIRMWGRLGVGSNTYGRLRRPDPRCPTGPYNTTESSHPAGCGRLADVDVVLIGVGMPWLVGAANPQLRRDATRPLGSRRG